MNKLLLCFWVQKKTILKILCILKILIKKLMHAFNECSNNVHFQKRKSERKHKSSLRILNNSNIVFLKCSIIAV